MYVFLNASNVIHMRQQVEKIFYIKFVHLNELYIYIFSSRILPLIEMTFQVRKKLRTHLFT